MIIINWLYAHFSVSYTCAVMLYEGRVDVSISLTLPFFPIMDS